MNDTVGFLELKTIAVGYGGVGKTSMLITKTSGEFPREYVPSVIDNHIAFMRVRGKAINLGLWDTGGGEDYARLRPLCYPFTDVFILLFDVSALSQFEDVESYWAAELKERRPGVPIVLVGSKIDLRDCKIKTISKEDGQTMAEDIGAAAYMEVSSLRNEGVDELFEEVAIIGYDYHTSANDKSKVR